MKSMKYFFNPRNEILNLNHQLEICLNSSNKVLHSAQLYFLCVMVVFPCAGDFETFTNLELIDECVCQVSFFSAHSDNFYFLTPHVTNRDVLLLATIHLPLVCSNYWHPNVALSLCFNHLVLSTFWQCRSAIPQRSAKPIANIHHTAQCPQRNPYMK